MTSSTQIRLKTLLFLFSCCILLTACDTRRQTPTLSLPNSLPLTPTLTVSSTPSPTASPMPTQTLEPGVEPTHTPVPVTTPQGSVEDYRLKAWDYATALRVYTEADNVPIAEDYDDLRSFYQLSLLEELYLSFPDLRSDPDLLRDRAFFKGLKSTYWSTYGFLHDHSVEPFWQGLEQALNDGSAKFPELTVWGEWIFTEDEFTPVVKTSRLFDESTPAKVLRISKEIGWDFFVLRENADGSSTVFALYPEWKQYWWDEETFQITDLNNNGREEIAIFYDGWGTGMSHFCHKQFFLYEWDGQAFQNLLSTPLNVLGDWHTCLDITFEPDVAGRSLIRAGISRNNDCEDYLYLEHVTYRWEADSFVALAGSAPTPPDSRKPDQCTINWALAAGANNDSALELLAAAVEDWPSDADAVWGPAANDYFKIKLATWYMRRGQVQRGIDLLKQVREAPAAPEFQFPSQLAATFLDTYESEGIYLASTAVGSFYEKAKEPFCGFLGCVTEEMQEQWGFSEPEWEVDAIPNSHSDDFQSIDTLSLDLKSKTPASLEDFQNHLKGIGITPLWVGEADANGQGQPDWLVDLDSVQILFLRQNDQIFRVNLRDIYMPDLAENITHRWETFRPGLKTPVINVYQVGTEIFAFHFLQKNDAPQLVFDLVSSDISLDSEQHVKVQDWSVQDGKLTVQYDGSEGLYAWDDTIGRLVPTGYAPDLLEENISQAERAIYIEDNPEQAIIILTNLLKDSFGEDYIWSHVTGYTELPRIRPYTEYLLGLAYERSGDPENAAQAYWQLWHEFPSHPFSLAAQSKLEIK